MPDRQLIWKAGINDFVLTVGAITGRFPPLGCYARVQSLSVLTQVGAATAIPTARWRILTLDSGVACTVAQAVTLPLVATITTFATALQASFLVNQQPTPALQQDGDSVAFAAGFLPPDLWLLPNDQMLLDLPLNTDGAVITQAVLRFYVPPQ